MNIRRALILLGGYLANLLLWNIFFPIEIVGDTILFFTGKSKEDIQTNAEHGVYLIGTYLFVIVGMLIAIALFTLILALGIAHLKPENFFYLFWFIGLIISAFRVGDEVSEEFGQERFSEEFVGRLTVGLGLNWGVSMIILYWWLNNYLQLI